jgi:hypothetical protein
MKLHLGKISKISCTAVFPTAALKPGQETNSARGKEHFL